MKIKKFGYQMIPLLFLAGGLLTGCVPAPVEAPTPMPQPTATMAPTQPQLPTFPSPTATPITIPSVLDLVSGPLAEAVYVAGGEFSLSGRTMISSASVLAVYLCRTGVEIGEAPAHPYCGSVFHILEKGQVEVLPGQAGEAGTFLQLIPYFVEKATPARLVVIASGEKGYALHVSSVEILLQP